MRILLGENMEGVWKAMRENQKKMEPLMDIMSENRKRMEPLVRSRYD